MSTSSEMNKFFNAEATKYQKCVLEKNPGNQYINDIETQIVEGSMLNRAIGNMVDIGIGTARFSSMFIDKATSLTGIDLSEEMLKISKTQLNTEKATFVHADIETLDITPYENKFDFLVCMRVFKYFKRPEQTILKFSKLCSKDGVLIVEYANKLSYLWFLKKINSLFPKGKNQTYLNSLCLLSKKEIKDYYEKAGMEIESIKQTTILPYFVFGKINSEVLLKPIIFIDKILGVLLGNIFARDLIVIAVKK